MIDPKRLAVWMDGLGLGKGTEISVDRITTGHSNELFLVQRGELRLALRRPPAAPLSPTAHDMVREFRVLGALTGSRVPVPTPVALCEDPGVAGASFYLMEMMEGVVARHRVPEGLSATELASTAVEALAAIHAFDWRAVGLADFGKPEGYLKRQTARWLDQLDRYRVRALPEIDEVGGWLQGHLPEPAEPALIHGDFTLVNLMFAPEPPVRLVAVLDWEQSTIGDPLVDLGWFLGLWHDPGETSLPGVEPGVVGFPSHPGMPTRSDLAARYASASSRDLSRLDFYCALALFKLACIMEGSYARFVSGRSDDPYFSSLETSVPALARRALTFVG